MSKENATYYGEKIQLVDSAEAEVLGLVTASPAANTIGARLKSLLTDIVLKAGTNIIGKVGIDQTTPGTTNGVQVNAELPAGTQNIGDVDVASIAAGANRIGKVTLRDATDTTDIDPLAEATFTGHVGEVQETPTEFSLLRRLKDLLTGIVLAAGTNIIGKVINQPLEWTEYLQGEDRPLTSDGIQYNVDDGDAVETTVQNTETDLYTFTFDNGRTGTIDFLTLGLTVALLQVTGAVNGVFRWYVRPGASGDWAEIYESGSIALPAAYSTASGSCSGIWHPTTELTYPFQLKLSLETDGATNMGKAKVQSSSIVLVRVK
jgi:hypothetical protein